MNPVLDDFLGKLDGCKSVDDCKLHFHGSLDDLGFSISAYVDISVPWFVDVTSSTFSEELVQSTTFPDDWRRHYGAENFHSVDPMYRISRSSVSPVLWSDVRKIETLSRGAKRVMFESHDFGLSDGLSIPIHAAGGGFALVSAVSRDSERAFEGAVREYRHTLHLMALYLHAAVQSKKGGDSPRESEIVLTPRETECLKWTAQGKSSWEISTILAIAERTVNFHLANAMRKLGVYNKAHAVARAFFLGLTEI